MVNANFFQFCQLATKIIKLGVLFGRMTPTTMKTMTKMTTNSYFVKVMQYITISSVVKCKILFPFASQRCFFMSKEMTSLSLSLSLSHTHTNACPRTLSHSHSHAYTHVLTHNLLLKNDSKKFQLSDERWVAAQRQ